MTKKNRRGYTIQWPFNLIYLLFVAEILLVLCAFIFGGIIFFNDSNISLIPVISLGLLTFVSIFFAFVSKEEEFEKAFREIIDKHELEFQKELSKNSKKIDLKFLKDFRQRYQAFKTYKFFVNPILWLYFSMFIGLIIILVIFTNIQYKFIILSIFMHFQVLFALFLITSIISVYVAYISEKNKTALVEYKIASALPGTVQFDFLKDKKVWFWIANREPKKYKAFITIEFISHKYKKRINEGYYGGTRAWNLNAFLGIHAPGMPIPKEVFELVKKNQKLEIKIYCVIKDEEDRLIEEKLPMGYVYDSKNNLWYLEP